MEDEQRRALREVTRAYLSGLVDHTSTATILASAAQFRRGDWCAMAELGLQGADIAQELGGAGLGQSAALLVHTEMGRALYAGPFLGTIGQVMPGLAALGATEPARKRLEQIAAGELTAAASVGTDDTTACESDSTDSAVTMSATGSGWQLDGQLACVTDAELADGLLVAVPENGQVSLLWIDADTAGVQIEPLDTVDLTRRMARVSLAGAPGELLAGPALGADSAILARQAVAAVRQGTVLALVAECVGLAERTLEMTVEYVKSRRQFGRPIGSFQAVKHRCAELVVLLEMARSALQLATTPASRPSEAATRLSAARVCAGESAFAIANEAIHLHGGIGFTWEFPLHLYYRRAKSNQQLLDPDGDQRIRLAAAVAALYSEQEKI